MITEGDPFWLALLKGFGEVFLLVLLAIIAVGIGKWLYSKIKRLELQSDWFGAGKTQRLEREANAKLRDRHRKEDEASQE